MVELAFLHRPRMSWVSNGWTAFLNAMQDSKEPIFGIKRGHEQLHRMTSNYRQISFENLITWSVERRLYDRICGIVMRRVHPPVLLCIYTELTIMANLYSGITMGRNTTRTMTIVRAGGISTAMTPIALTVSRTLQNSRDPSVAIPPFIVWQGKTHRQSYYASEIKTEATFAVSESGYMDDDLGLQYIKTYFDPYTRDPNFKVKGADARYGGPARCLIVDGHSSHIAWRVI